MDISLLLCIVSVAFTGLTSGTDLLPDGPLNAAVGETVMFTTTLTPSGNKISSVGWTVDGRIIISIDDRNITGPEYEGRITLSMSTGSLELRNVALNDSGEYIVAIFLEGGLFQTGSTRLNVYEPVSNVRITTRSTDVAEFSSVRLSCSSSGSSPSYIWMNGSSEVTASDRVQLTDGGSNLTIVSVTRYDQGPFRCHVFNPVSSSTSDPVNLTIILLVSNVTLMASSTDLVEFNSSVRLSCSSSGSHLSYIWMNSSSEVTASDRVQLTDENSTLTIVNVTRYDQGPFRCHVFNPVSNGTSAPLNLTISYGPENTTLTISPLQTSQYFAEGSNITLSCSADSRPAAIFNWDLNGSKLPDSGPELRLMNINMNHSGNYSCQAFNNKTLRYETSQPSTVSVLVRVANVVVTSNHTDLVEFNSSVRLSCSSSGSLLSFLWLNSSSEVTESDRVQLTDGNSTLTIFNVTRYDQGPFRCRVSNPVSTGTSDPVNLSISYGPEYINLTKSPSQKYYEEGSIIALMCSAVSKPSALFYWFLNGNLQSDTGSELKLMNIQMSHSGNYSCQASNNKTLRYQTSQPSVVSVLGKISAASVTPSTNLVIEGNSVNLTCDAAGSIFTRKWMKDGSDLILDDNIKLHDENRVLSFHSPKKTHTGEYSCIVSNPVSSIETKYNMVVNYGPENVKITGKSQIHLGQPLKLNCSAESTPSASYIWKLNGTEIHNSSVFMKEKTEFSDSGNYTCEAMNNITRKTSSSVHALTVQVIPEKTSGCSGGCIAGIVIAVLVVCGAAAGGGYYIYRKKNYSKRSSRRNTTTRTSGEGQDNTGYSSSQELNYADVSFFQSKEGGRVHIQSQNDTSDYAEVRVNNNSSAASSPPSYDAHLQRMKSQAPQPGANGTATYAQVHKT